MKPRSKRNQGMVVSMNTIVMFYKLMCIYLINFLTKITEKRVIDRSIQIKIGNKMKINAVRSDDDENEEYNDSDFESNEGNYITYTIEHPVA